MLRDPKLPEDAGARLRTLLATEPLDELRVCNFARNTLLELLGTFPAEWDLVIAPHSAAEAEDGTVRARDFFPGLAVYAEEKRNADSKGLGVCGG